LTSTSAPPHDFPANHFWIPGNADEYPGPPRAFKNSRIGAARREVASAAATLKQLRLDGAQIGRLKKVLIKT